MEEKDLKNTAADSENEAVDDGEAAARAAAMEEEDILKEESEAREERPEDSEVSEEAGFNEDETEGEAEAVPDKRDVVIADLTDRLQRSMAEFDNFRKRNEREKAGMFDLGAKSIAERILPVVDNFERALAAAPSEGDSKAFADGIQMIYSQMINTLDGLGIKAIDCVGKPFDPNFHNAILHVEDESFGDNEIVEELLKGYMYKDTVLRHSMVKVAN